MRWDFLALLISLACLPGCKLAEFQADSVKPTVSVSPNAAHVEVSPEAVTATGTLNIDRVIQVDVPPNAVNISAVVETPPVNVEIRPGAAQLNIHQGALTLSLPPEAVKVTLTIASGAVLVQPQITIQEGAFTIRGAEVQKGAISFNPWLVGLLALSALLWMITKVRRHRASKTLTEHKPSPWDVIF